jgi:hypothetical protein
MSVTSYGRSFKMTALNDERTGICFAQSIALSGTGMSAGEHLVISDSGGSVLIDHYIETASGNENKEFLVHPICAQGIKITTAPTGTWSVIVNVE